MGKDYRVSKVYKKLITFTLLSVVRNENKNLVSTVSSIVKISKDNIKKNKRLYLFKNLFTLLLQVS